MVSTRDDVNVEIERRSTRGFKARVWAVFIPRLTTTSSILLGY
jgi:hypothetical protein